MIATRSETPIAWRVILRKVSDERAERPSEADRQFAGAAAGAVEDDGEEGGYSLGLGRWDTEYGEIITHSGAVSGFVSIGMYLPEYEAIVVVLAASAETPMFDIAFDALDALVAE